MKEMLAGATCALACVLGCGSNAASQEARIVGGAYDTTDTSVVAVLVTSADGPQNDSLCSGTVVAPHVVLTAAHCLSEAVVGPIDHVTIFTGQNALDPIQTSDAQNLVGVATTTIDKDFTANASNPTHDIALVTTSSAMTLAPIALNHDGLGAGDKGDAAHAVGFGELDGTSDSAGPRRSLDTTIFDIDDEHLFLESTLCEGDSGGPTLITKNGETVVAGVHSFTDAANCLGIGADTRVDQHTGEIDDAINAADPGFLPGGCDASGAPTPPNDIAGWMIAFAISCTVRACRTRPRSSKRL